MSIADSVVPGKVSGVDPRHSYHMDKGAWGYFGYHTHLGPASCPV